VKISAKVNEELSYSPTRTSFASPFV